MLTAKMNKSNKNLQKIKLYCLLTGSYDDMYGLNIYSPIAQQESLYKGN